MDLTRIIQQLHAERDKLSQAIATLEQFQQERNTTVSAHRTRGRKSMDAEERKVVAERMKTYWAKKRQQDTKQSKEDS
jgi:arylsulfatase A-like enzyme